MKPRTVTTRNMLKFLSAFLGSQSPAFIWWVTATQGREVGQDSLGNRYFTGKARKGYTRERRWVMYPGKPEPSLVPPEWHGWLHYQTDTIPSADSASYRKPWQKPHRPNVTGLSAAYRPQRAKATGDYRPWTPSE